MFFRSLSYKNNWRPNVNTKVFLRRDKLGSTAQAPCNVHARNCCTVPYWWPDMPHHLSVSGFSGFLIFLSWIFVWGCWESPVHRQCGWTLAFERTWQVALNFTVPFFTCRRTALYFLFIFFCETQYDIVSYDADSTTSAIPTLQQRKKTFACRWRS